MEAVVKRRGSPVRVRLDHEQRGAWLAQVPVANGVVVAAGEDDVGLVRVVVEPAHTLRVRAAHRVRRLHRPHVHAQHRAATAHAERVRVVRVPAAAAEDPPLDWRRGSGALGGSGGPSAVRQRVQAQLLLCQGDDLLGQHGVPHYPEVLTQRRAAAQLHHLTQRRGLRRRGRPGGVGHCRRIRHAVHAPQLRLKLRARRKGCAHELSVLRRWA